MEVSGAIWDRISRPVHIPARFITKVFCSNASGAMPIGFRFDATRKSHCILDDCMENSGTMI